MQRDTGSLFTSVLCLRLDKEKPQEGVNNWIIDDGSLLSFVGDDAGPTPIPTICPMEFSDVPEDSTFYPYIKCLACRGVVSGYPDGTFRPGNPVTRGQIAKIVSNAVGLNDDPEAQIFEDVTPDSTFYAYIERLAVRGYMSGYACGGSDSEAGGEPCVPPANRPYFRPEGTATRGQIAKIVANAASLSDPITGQTFEDVPPASTFYEYVERLERLGVVSGYDCGRPNEPCVPPANRPYFRPNANVSRGQSAKIVSSTFFPDCQTLVDMKK